MIKDLKDWIKKRKKLFAVILKGRFLIYKYSWTYKPLWLFPLFRRRYTPAINRIGLEITTACNLNCYNCESSSRQGPSNEYMSLQQIDKFVNESIELKWRWKMIDLRGGEPTLHPDFFGILEMIKKYKTFYPECRVIITTNAFGNKTKEILGKVPDWVIPDCILNKYSGRNASNIYSSYNVAPIDLCMFRHSADFTKGCWRTEYCGLGLSRYGFYSCCPGASVDRIFAFDIGIKRLSLVDNESLLKQMNMLCRYCGHYKEPNERVFTEKMSKSWTAAYEKYNKDKPVISLY